MYQSFQEFINNYKVNKEGIMEKTEEMEKIENHGKLYQFQGVKDTNIGKIVHIGNGLKEDIVLYKTYFMNKEIIIRGCILDEYDIIHNNFKMVELTIDNKYKITIEFTKINNKNDYIEGNYNVYLHNMSNVNDIKKIYSYDTYKGDQYLIETLLKFLVYKDVISTQIYN